MTIQPDVLAVARHWGLDPALLQAVDLAEGNLVRAVQCSIPSVTTRQEALEITARSCVHALCDWVQAHARVPFVEFWAARWAPRGATNDPHDLNANWPRNVLAHWASPSVTTTT